MTESEVLAFLSVVKNGTISSAAKELYLSQPALSRRLTLLEEQLGYTLLLHHKGQRYVELTQAGKSFVSLAQRWQAHIVLDQMLLLEYFLVNTDSWAAAPAYIAQYMHKRHGLAARRFSEPPPEEIIYYLQPKELTKINSYNSSFLALLKELLPVYYPEITLLL